ncbi:MAG: sulfatase [Rubinisphaera brasiliensis]|uniref:sulfatase n=1 Tax=Rubinisphaera brasiliensis TaxID=119 RepID=UPI00391C1C0D
MTTTLRGICCGAAALLLSLVAGSANAAERPNVLFLICDDLNCDLACYGHDQVQSPNIDRLAEQGVLFERTYCQYPLCGPSRASFMTGLYPQQTNITRNSIYLRDRLPDVISMSQLFSQNGYTASRVGKIYHYNVPKDIGTPGHDDPQSWTRTFNPRGRDKDEEDLVFSLRKGSYGGTLSWHAADGTDAEQTDGIAAAEAVKQLNEYAKSEEPFFMAVGLYRPHTPYVAPKKYFDLYPLDSIRVPQIPAGYLDSLPKPAQTSVTRKKEQVNLEESLAKQAIQAYYASITFADAQLGQILDALNDSGLSDNTIVLFTSDHGYHMGEHGHYQKTTLFENALRVPLIISSPGMKAAGGQVSTPVEMVDFYPTLTELAGLDAPEYVAGVSLADALDDSTSRPREDALSEYANGYSLRTDRFRYTSWGPEGQLGVELYDHQTDPAEMHNLAGNAEHADVQKRLAKRLEQRIAASNKQPAELTRLTPGQKKQKK